MKHIRFYPAQIALAASALVVSGCGTPRDSGSQPASVAQATPFLSRADYSDRLGLVMRDALATHRFSIPWIALKGSDASLWFVADRFQSEHRFDRIQVHVKRDEQVTASITAYQFGPSDWAILGTRFADFRPEAELIEAEIASRLGGDKDAVGR